MTVPVPAYASSPNRRPPNPGICQMCNRAIGYGSLRDDHGWGRCRSFWRWIMGRREKAKSGEPS